MDPLQLLFRDASAEAADLPPALAHWYPAPISLAPPILYANFVESIDGVVALEPELPSGPDISGRHQGDRFVMGLLRAMADTVLVGAGTLRADSGHLWTPEYIFPPGGQAFADLRRALGLAGEVKLAVVTATGEIDPREPALEHAIVLTTSTGESKLRGRLASTAELVALGERELQPQTLIATLQERGMRTVLTEGGPNLVGGFLEAGLLDELFLTLSPVLAGRPPGSPRLGLVEGVALLPGAPLWTRLLTVQRSGSHLFLRYDLRRR